jgi:hypothetical protein
VCKFGRVQMFLRPALVSLNRLKKVIALFKIVGKKKEKKLFVFYLAANIIIFQLAV